MKRSLRNSYPKIIFPYEIAHIFNSIPPKIEIPDYPILPVKKEIQKPNEINIDSNGCLINSLIGFVITGIGIVLLKADIDFGVVFVPVGGAVTIYYVFFNQIIEQNKQKKRKQYEIEYKKYEEAIRLKDDEYRNQLLVYNLKKHSYEIDCENAKNENLVRQSEEYINTYRYEQLLTFLKKSEKPNILKKEFSKSVTHSYFKNFLILTFGNKVYDNFFLKDTTYVDLIYIPDYTIHEHELNLYIDIEIDEPYIGVDGTPLHFINSNDDKRDDFFTRKKWLVIRFAEIQIINNPLACCDLISEMIMNLKSSKLNDLSTLSNIEIIHSWSKEDAHKFAFNRYRSSYLPSELNINIQYETLENDRNNLNPIYDTLDNLPF